MPVVSPEVALAVGRKKLRYARYVDTKNWDAFEKEVSRPETRYDYQGMDGKTLLLGPTTLRFSCTRDFRRAFETGFAPLQTQHIVAPGDFEQWADDEVRAIFAFEDQLIAPPFGIWASLRGGGFYYETWKRIDGEWFLQDIRMRRTYQEATLLMQFLFLLMKLGIKLS